MNLEIGDRDRDRENRTQHNASQVKRKRHMHLPDTWARIKSVHPHTRQGIDLLMWPCKFPESLPL